MGLFALYTKLIASLIQMQKFTFPHQKNKAVVDKYGGFLLLGKSVN